MTIWYIDGTRARNGNGTETSPWNELNKLDKSRIQPGDRVLIRPGHQYQTPLNISGLQGTSTNKIHFELDTRYSGIVEIFGGQGVRLPKDGATSFSGSFTGVPEFGVRADNCKWIVFDGKRCVRLAINGAIHNVRLGFFVHGFAKHGWFITNTQDSTFRFCEQYNNGSARQESGKWFCNRDAGFRYKSNTRLTFKNCLSRNAAGDQWQSDGGGTDITWDQCWALNDGSDINFANPRSDRKPFNNNVHPDGNQEFAGGAMSGRTWKRSILGPGNMQNIIYGGTSAISDLLVEDCLLLPVGNALVTTSSSTGRHNNWTFRRCMLIQRTNDPNPAKVDSSIRFDNGSLTIEHSIIVGGKLTITNATQTYTDNYLYDVVNGTLAQGIMLASNHNPLTTTPARTLVNTWADWRIAAGSPALKKGPQPMVGVAAGSSGVLAITSAANLVEVWLRESDTNIEPLVDLTFNAGAMAFTSPWAQTADGIGLVSSADQTTNIMLSGRAIAKINLTEAMNVRVRANVKAATTGSNSVWINFDSEPVDPNNIWDVPLTSGTDTSRTAAWRGTNPPDNPEIDPKVWSLSAGEHTLIIRSREKDFEIRTITIEPVINEEPGGNEPNPL